MCVWYELHNRNIHSVATEAHQCCHKLFTAISKAISHRMVAQANCSVFESPDLC